MKLTKLHRAQQACFSIIIVPSEHHKHSAQSVYVKIKQDRGLMVPFITAIPFVVITVHINNKICPKSVYFNP